MHILLNQGLPGLCQTEPHVRMCMGEEDDTLIAWHSVQRGCTVVWAPLCVHCVCHHQMPTPMRGLKLTHTNRPGSIESRCATESGVLGGSGWTCCMRHAVAMQLCGMMEPT